MIRYAQKRSLTESVWRDNRRTSYWKFGGTIMGVATRMWRIQNDRATRLPVTELNYERRLEEILEDDLSLISEPRKWMCIGRQVTTASNGFADLLALDENANVVILELKRDKTDREVVSQCLDYAAWVSTLEYEHLAEIYAAYLSRQKATARPSLEQAFSEFFGSKIPDEVNTNHEMVIVASALHPEAERVLAYLSTKYAVPIGAVFFSFYRDGDAEYLSRTWLEEPVSSAPVKPKSGKWNGEYYASFGYPKEVVEAGRQYGFIVAGGGDWYTKTLDLLAPGERVWVNFGAGKGFGGVARVLEGKMPVDDVLVTVDGLQVPLLSVFQSDVVRSVKDDPEGGTYAVRVAWEHSVPYGQGVWEKGFFANQNTVACPVTAAWPYTVTRLKEIWNIG